MFDFDISPRLVFREHRWTRFVLVLLVGFGVATATTASVMSAPLDAPLPVESSEISVPATADAIQESKTANEKSESKAAEAKKKKKRGQASAAAAMLLLVGILVIGVLALYMTVRWGRRLKKSIRQPATCTADVDDFWYLAKKQADVTKNGSSVSKPGDDSTSAHDDEL